jgi:maleamate amidohydrolase
MIDRLRQAAQHLGTEAHISEHEFGQARAVYSQSGIGNRVGFGKRAAVLVVDLQNGFTDPASRVGSNLDDVIASTVRLLAEARAARVPVAFTAIGFQPGEREVLPWLSKMPGLADLVDGSRWCDIDARVERRESEPLWIKRAPSGFFARPRSASSPPWTWTP